MKIATLSLVGALTLAGGSRVMENSPPHMIAKRNADSIQSIIDLTAGKGVSPETKTITLKDASIIQGLIDSAPEGGIINIPEGQYTVRTPLIPKKGQKLLGSQQMTFLKLADKVNQPVIIVENDDVEVANMRIDGNRQGQTQERSVREKDRERYSCVNGITVYCCDGAFLHDLIITNARSAGFCSQFGVSYMRVERIVTEKNQIDGFTMYETRDSSVSSLKSRNNPAAGISMDCDNEFIVYKDLDISGNGTCLYLRASSLISFQGGNFSGDGGEVSRNIDYNHNPFIGRDHDGCCTNIEFREVTFTDKDSLKIKDDSQVTIRDNVLPEVVSSGSGS